MGYLKAFKFLFIAGLIAAVAYFAYDYGKTSAENAANEREQLLLDKLEVKESEAYQLAVKLANQKVNFKTIEKKVIKYVEKNSDKQCVVNDHERLLIRADAVREHNRAIGILESAAGTNDATGSTDGEWYTSDGQILAEDISNIETCARNAKKLRDLQLWISSQMGAKQ